MPRGINFARFPHEGYGANEVTMWEKGASEELKSACQNVREGHSSWGKSRPAPANLSSREITLQSSHSFVCRGHRHLELW